MKKIKKQEREHLALALVLLRDYKFGEPEASMLVFELAQQLNIMKEFKNAINNTPMMTIEPKCPETEVAE